MEQNECEVEMRLPKAHRGVYETFLRETGFDNPDPQALLMELASLSMEVYLKEVAWLSEFIGKIERDAIARPDIGQRESDPDYLRLRFM